MKATHTVLLHGLKYEATITAENEDGSFEVTASALNNGHDFSLSGVRLAPKNPSGLDPAVPFLVTGAPSDEDDTDEDDTDEDDTDEDDTDEDDTDEDDTDEDDTDEDDTDETTEA